MSVKLLNEHNLELLSLKGGCTGWSESTLVKMPHCWKTRAAAHIQCTEVEEALSQKYTFMSPFYILTCVY